MNLPIARGAWGARLLLALFLAGSAVLSFYAHRAQNLQHGESDQPRSALLEEPAPEFSVPVLTVAADAPETRISLADYRGKVVFISFWASWCRPCDYELPVLNQFYLDHRDQGVEVLAISTDEDRQAALEYMQSRNFALPMLWDEGGRVAALYHVEALPTLIVVDPDGRVRHSERGLRVDLNSWLALQLRRFAPQQAPVVGGD